MRWINKDFYKEPCTWYCVLSISNAVMQAAIDSDFIEYLPFEYWGSMGHSASEKLTRAYSAGRNIERYKQSLNL